MGTALLCAHCKLSPRRPGGRWCKNCHAAYEKVRRRQKANTAMLERMIVALVRNALKPTKAATLRPRRLPVKSGDKKAARARVNHLVEYGFIPRPQSLKCADCGHIGPDRYHQYDHYLGYEAEHHDDVEPVCIQCHMRRDRMRKHGTYVYRGTSASTNGGVEQL